MARTKVSEWSATPASNTDIDGINIAEGMAPSGVNNAIREMMAQIKDFQAGTSGDPFNGPVSGALNGTLGATTPASASVTTLVASGAFTYGGVTLSNSVTGTGSMVLSNSPTLVSPALGTPASGVVTNLTGTASININGTVGATTANTGAFTSLTTSGAVTHNAGTANGVAYLNGSKVLTSGSALTFDGSNLGLGVTPSAWSTLGGSALEITAQGNGLSANPNALYYSANAYFSTDNWRYARTGFATQFLANSNAGSFNWNIAPSGTAGNAISFTQAMTLDASGNLGIVTTSPASYNAAARQLVVGTTSGNNGITVAAGSDSQGSLFFADGTGSGAQQAAGYLAYVHSTDAMLFGTGNTERARIDSSGNLIQSAPTTPPSLTTNGQMVFNLTSNTNLRVSVRGSDGVTRTANITLA